ncbi:MAG: outer membrane beta-barrel protein [Desulfuromonadales bacterium]
MTRFLWQNVSMYSRKVQSIKSLHDQRKHSIMNIQIVAPPISKESHMRFSSILSRAGCLFCLCLAINLFSVTSARSAEDFSNIYFQGYLGAAGFDEDAMTFYESSDTDPAVISTTDLSSMPYLGISAQFALGPEPTHIGIDSSLLFGWRSEDTTVSAQNNQLRVKIDSKLWLLDLAVGVYAQTVLAERWRLYGAVGPMLLFGDYSDDTEEEDLSATPRVAKESNSDSAFGFGGYAKIGLEYALTYNTYMGVALRGVTTNLDFDRALDDDSLKGVQGFVTFTRAY